MNENIETAIEPEVVVEEIKEASILQRAVEVPKDEKSMMKLFKHEKRLFHMTKSKSGGNFNRKRSVLRTVNAIREKLGLKVVELKNYI